MKTSLRITIGIIVPLCLTLRSHGEPVLTVKAKDVFSNKQQLELIAALVQKDFKRADGILKSLPVDERAANGGTVLWWQANLGDFAGFDYLLKHGAKPGFGMPKDTYGTLELCAKQEDPRLLQAAIEHGGNANMVGYFTHQTPIYAAILARRNDNVKMLLDHGACPNVMDPTGLTPLVWTAYCRAFDIVPLLLKNGADPSTQDSQGATALEILRKDILGSDDPMHGSQQEAIKLLEVRMKAAPKQH